MKEEDVFELVSWYQKNKRDLPWRHTKDSYKIWISEVMLQQTRVEAVKEYYKRFLEEIPTLEDLAFISEDKLLKLWEGLGYYSRAKNLKKCAEILVKDGLNALPDTEEEIVKLPGIGPYTAGAILSIAYLKDAPAIDGNVMRVLSRVFADEREINSTVVREYTALLKRFMPHFPSDDFTQSFIELGALICIPNGMPKCLECPFEKRCLAHQEKKELDYPKKKEKKTRKKSEKTVFVLKYQNTYALLKRGVGLLEGMYEFPNVDEELSKKSVKKYLKDQHISFTLIEELGLFKHVFSHVEWLMTAYMIELSNQADDYIWATLEEMSQVYSIPTAFQKIIEKFQSMI